MFGTTVRQSGKCVLIEGYGEMRFEYCRTVGGANTLYAILLDKLAAAKNGAFLFKKKRGDHGRVREGLRGGFGPRRLID
jgi:hypothetical protein